MADPVVILRDVYFVSGTQEQVWWVSNVSPLCTIALGKIDGPGTYQQGKGNIRKETGEERNGKRGQGRLQNWKMGNLYEVDKGYVKVDFLIMELI